MVPVDSVEVPRDSTYSGTLREAACFRLRDCHPLWSAFPDGSTNKRLSDSHVKGPTTPPRKTPAVWAISVSLAATQEIEVSFFSCGYLDVSVHRVCHARLWIQRTLVREPRDQCSFNNSPGLFAVFHALHSLLTPRHPPCALSSLTTLIQPSPADKVLADFPGRRRTPNRLGLYCGFAPPATPPTEQCPDKDLANSRRSASNDPVTNN